MKRKGTPSGLRSSAFAGLLPAVALALYAPRAQPAVEDFRSFTNATAIAIVDESSAVPYPSAISVSGLVGVITNVSVTLRGLTHSYPDDIDVLLVGPGGRRAMLMSDAGGSFPVNEVTLTFDTVSRPIPNSAQISSGAYSAANWGGSTGDNFLPPAPAGPHSASLDSFDGGIPNGTWALYIKDDIPVNDGELANGWSLTIATGPEPRPSLSITKTTPVIRLAWPTNFLGYALEACVALPLSLDWAAVTNAVTVTNEQYQVVLPADEPQRFFRLQK